MKLLSLQNEDDNFYFAYNVLKNVNYTPTGHERHWISKFSNFVTLVPSGDEQTAIGNFFQSLDKAIALQESKVEELKEQKKTLLNKMFI